MNNIKIRGFNIMISLLFFIMSLGVVIAFISPINSFLNIAMQSDNLNCQGYIANGNVNDTLSFNSSLNGGSSGSPISCLALKLYLPYILLVFLIGGLVAVLGGKSEALSFGVESEPAY